MTYIYDKNKKKPENIFEFSTPNKNLNGFLFIHNILNTRGGNYRVVYLPRGEGREELM